MPTEPARNEMQFRLRTLLIGMALVAIFMTGLTVYVCDWGLHARLRLCMWLGIYFLVMLATLGWRTWSRTRAVRRAGSCWFVSRRVPWVEVALISVSITFACIGLLFTVLFMQSSRYSLHPMTNLYMAWNGIWWYAMVMLALESRTYAPRLCEHGVLVTLKLIRWDRFESWQWNKNDQAVLRSRLGDERVTVAPADRERLAELLDRQISTELHQDV